MAKSKRKSGSSTDISRWETELAQASLNEDDWKALIVFMVPEKSDDKIHANILSETISTGLRKLFNVIDYESLLKEIRELAHGKAAKGKIGKPPQFIEIIDLVKNSIDHGDDLAPSLLAKLLKFKLLMLKQKDLDRREEEKKAIETAAKQAKQEERSRSKAGSSQGKRSKSQSPGRKKGKKDDAPSSPKKDTKLKRRGELEDTFKTIDDEPDGADDPSHYIVIHGIYDASVLQLLIELGVSADAIIKISSEVDATEENQKLAEAEDEDMTDEVKLAADEEKKKLSLALQAKLDKFWHENDIKFLEAISGSKMKDIANLCLNIQKQDVPQGDLTELEQEKKTEYGSMIFGRIANICYDLLDAKKRYKRYIENTKLTHVSSMQETLQPQIPLGASMASIAEATPDGRERTTKPDLRYYEHLMDKMPCESLSVPLILDSLLKQVEVTVDQKNPLDEPVPPREDQLDEVLGQHLDKTLKRLGLLDKADDMNSEDEENKGPVIIYNGDDRTKRLFHLKKMKELDAESIEEMMFSLHLFTSLTQMPSIQDSDRVEILNRKQQLTYFCAKGINAMKFERLVSLLALESVPLKTVGLDEEILDPIKKDSLDWDDPYTASSEDFPQNTRGDNKNDGDHLEDSKNEEESSYKKLRNLTKYCYAEHFQPKILIQVLDKAAQLCPYADVYYHLGLDSLFLILHNPRDDQLKNTKTWSTWLHSNVGFRNYLDHIADEVEDWQKEEDINEEILNKPSTPQVPEREPTPAPLKTGSRHNLVTRTEMEELKAAEEEKGKKKSRKGRSRSGSPNKRPPSDAQKMKSPEKKDRNTSAKKRTPSAKKTGSRMGTARRQGKSVQDKKAEEEIQEVPTTEQMEKEYRFQGYDVGDELIHLSGEISYLFPKDGSLIKVETTRFKQGSESVRTSIWKDNHLLTMHMTNSVNFTSKLDQNEEKVNDLATINAETDANEENEILRAFLQLPALPHLPQGNSESVSLSFTLDDGLSIGIAPSIPPDAFNQMNSIKSTLIDVQNFIQSLQSTSGNTAAAANPKGNSPKGKRKQEDDARKQEEIEKQLELEARERIDKLSRDINRLRKANLSRNNMTVACPDGLNLVFVHDEVYEETSTRVLRVRQEYPLRMNGIHPCEQDRLKPATEEKSRCILMDGKVVKYMRDGSVVVLFPDGSICNSTPRCSSPNAGKYTDLRSQLNTGASTERPLTDTVVVEQTCDFDWDLTNSFGERYSRKHTGPETRLSDLHMSHAVCPKTSQIMETREDGLVMIRRPDGTRIVEHNDGTRITTVFSGKLKQTDNETGEEEIKSLPKVKSIKVECAGFATVNINASMNRMQTQFGNGTSITSFVNGSYQVSKPDSTKLLINEQGDVIFAPKKILSHNLPLDAMFDVVDQNSLPTGLYVMKNSAVDCLMTVDCNGNKFSVSCSGDVIANRSEKGDGEAAEEQENPSARYFIINRDGSGEELLHDQVISKYLEKADKDPSIAVLRSEGKDSAGVSGITVLQPFEGTIGDQWLKEKDEKELIPFGLKERDFKSFPPKELKSNGPEFGSNAGVGFQVATKPPKKQPKPSLRCPNVLQIRNLVHFGGLDHESRRSMEAGLTKYHHFLKKQKEQEDGWLLDDPRSEEEIGLAEELAQKFKAMQVNADLQIDQENSISRYAEDYVEAVAPPPSPPPQKAEPKRPKASWEQDKIELAELKYAKNYLKFGIVPPYFDTEEGQRFLFQNAGEMNIEGAASKLARETVHPSQRPISVESSEVSESRPVPSEMERISELFGDKLSGDDQLNDDASNDAKQRSSLQVTASVDARPGNPTPAEAMQGAASQASNWQARPFNPTPMHSMTKYTPNGTHQGHNDAFKSNEINRGEDRANLNANLDNVGDEFNRKQFEEGLDPIDEGQHFNSLKYTVTGEVRTNPVLLPRSTQGSKPGALLNNKFFAIEENARRQVKTASIAGSVNPEKTAQMRGFKIVPDFVDFGILKEGICYSYPVMLENVGIDSYRFKIKQPPPSTGLKVIYKPGPVAAGMSVRIEIEIFAVAVGVEGDTGVGSVAHHIEIITETEAMYLPVTATILTSHEYNNRSDDSPRGGPSESVLLINNRPTSREELTRPRKD